MSFYFFLEPTNTYPFTILGKSRFCLIKLMLEKLQFSLYTWFNFRDTMGQLINCIILSAALNLQIICQFLELCKNGSTQSTILNYCLENAKKPKFWNSFIVLKSAAHFFCHFFRVSEKLNQPRENEGWSKSSSKLKMH